MKSLSRRPAAAITLPSTVSASPYVDAVSIRRPPALTSVCTSLRPPLRVASLALSKTLAVPRPTAGRCSPLLGIARVMGAAFCARALAAPSRARLPQCAEFAPRHIALIVISLLPTPRPPRRRARRSCACPRTADRKASPPPAAARIARSRRASVPASASCRTPSRTVRRSHDRSPRRSGFWPCTFLPRATTVKNT